MELTNEVIKNNLQKILDLEVLYRRTGLQHIYKELSETFGVSASMIYEYEKKGQLSEKLESLFKSAKNLKSESLDLDELKQLSQSFKKRMKRGLGARPPLESEMREAQNKSRSAFEAARMLGISYNTYKKYAKSYGIFDNLKNPFGYGIKKYEQEEKTKKKPKNLTEEEWNTRLRIRELKKKHLHKYHTKTGEVQYGCALYFITIPKGDARKEFINKWGMLPIKIGISKDVVRRYNDLVLKKQYVESDEPKWIEWNEKAEIINMIPFYTWDECINVESRIHKYIRDNKIKGLISKGGGEAEEMFEADFDKINEGIETYVTGWRMVNWNSDEMNNDYGTCYTIPYSIQYSQYRMFGESEIGSMVKNF